MKFSRLAKPTEPEFRPRRSLTTFIVTMGSSGKKLLEKRLETDVAHEVGGVLIADMKADDLNTCYDFCRDYLPAERIIAVPLVAEGQIVAGSKDMDKVLENRHLYLKRLNLAVERAKKVIVDYGISVIEVFCSTGGHAIITIETLLKIQNICTYRKAILIQATEKLAKRNESELLTFFKRWTRENEENQFFYARNPIKDENIDYANAITINATYGLPSADLTDFFANMITIDGQKQKLPQAFTLESFCGTYPLYKWFWFFKWFYRQNIHRTQRAVAKVLDASELTNYTLGILSGNIVSNFMEEEAGRLYDKYDTSPEIRQFNQIKIDKEFELDFNFCVGKFELLNGVDSPTPTIEKLFKKMEDMP